MFLFAVAMESARQRQVPRQGKCKRNENPSLEATVNYIHGSFGENIRQFHSCPFLRIDREGSQRWGNAVHRGALVANVWLIGALLCMLFLAVCPPVVAQTPIPAATHPASKDSGGFSPGWTLGARFEGDYS